MTRQVGFQQQLFGAAQVASRDFGKHRPVDGAYESPFQRAARHAGFLRDMAHAEVPRSMIPDESQSLGDHGVFLGNDVA